MRKAVLGLLVPLILSSCEPGPKSARGFSLPDGDAEAGQAAFVELLCVACHSVEGTEFAVDTTERAMDVRLGGKVHRVRTYGELVTAIIHPSEDFMDGYPEEAVARDGESLMGNYNAKMTVGQMIDLVAFLQSKYTEYLPNEYDPYFP